MTTPMELVLLIIVAMISVFSLRFGLYLLRADKGAYDVNRNRSQSILNVLLGKVRTKKGDFRDFNVQAGLAVSTKTNNWVEQGILSDEAVDGLFDTDKIRS